MECRASDQSGLMFANLITFGRRERKHGAAQGGKACLDLGIDESGVYFPIEPIHDLGGRSLGGSSYRIGLIARHEIIGLGRAGTAPADTPRAVEPSRCQLLANPVIAASRVGS
jgi:hypothetical protein